MNITLEDLKLCAAMARQASEWSERVERLRSMAERSTSAWREEGGGGTNAVSDTTGNWTVKLLELEERRKGHVDAMMEHMMVVDEAINSIRAYEHRRIMRYRYMDGMTWAEVVSKTCFCESYCYKMHKEALEMLGLKDDSQVE